MGRGGTTPSLAAAAVSQRGKSDAAITQPGLPAEKSLLSQEQGRHKAQCKGHACAPRAQKPGVGP